MNSKPILLLTTLLTGSAAWLSGSANAQQTLTLQTIHSLGTNTSPGAAQTLDLSDATNVPLFDAALTAFNARNSDRVLQDATSFTAAGQFVSPQFFPFGGSTVGVNSNLNVVGHLTAPGTAGATNYFGFAETAGAQIGLFGKATQPPNQGTELLLSDPNANLVAVATGNASDGLSSILDFTVQDDESGTWQAAITQGLSTTVPINYLLQVQLPYSALSQFTTNVIGSGQEKSGSLGTYDVNANIGDDLAFDVKATTPLTATELELFDPNGNLVAVAAGNVDGLSSRIDFTVPDGVPGEWQIEVVPSQEIPVPQAYAYDLAIQGATGLGPVNPSPVPEPSTWALVLAGFVSLGLMSWRRAGREMSPVLSAPLRG
jgi:PEP-CTERM motif